MEKKVLIIIVTFNGERWIQRCLDSAAQTSIEHDIMIIDNASEDRTLQLVGQSPEKPIIIRSDKNLGFGAANNIGLKYAIDNAYDYVYLLNQDAYIEKDTIERLVGIHSWNPSFGVLSPVQTDAEGVADAQFANKTGIRTTTNLDIPVKVDFVMAAHWLIPVSVLKDVGGFSPTFHHYGEDDNWLDRLHFHGYLCGVVTSVAAIHDRARREQSKEQKCTRKCLIPIIRMSNPEHPWTFLRSLAWLAGCSVKNLSLIPVKSISSLWKRRREIRANRAASKSKGAFLN